MKKLLAGCLAAVMMLSGLSVAAGAVKIEYDDTYTIGDVDGNGKVDIKDSYLLKGCIMSDEASLAAASKDAGDLVADGKLNTRDSFQLKLLLTGNITKDSLERDAQIYKLTIGGKDISEFTIYAPKLPSENYNYDGTDDNASYAAEVMQKYVRYATGIELPIVKLGDTEPVGSAIVFHWIERHTEENDGNTALADEYGTEGYRYKVENGRLDVWGTYRGNMYAVYEILEDYLGFRFTDDKYVFEYKSRYVDIPEGTDTDIVQPSFLYRYSGQNMGDNMDDYAIPRRMNAASYYRNDGTRYGIMRGPQIANAHSYELYMSMYLGEADESLKETEPAKYYEAKLKDGEDKMKVKNWTQLNWQPCMSVIPEEDYNDTHEAYLDYLENNCDFYKIINGMHDCINRVMSWNSECYRYKGCMRTYILDGEKSVSFSQNDNIMNCKCTYCSAKANGTMIWADEIDKFVGKPEGFSGIYIEAAGKAAEILQEDFPGMRTHAILYDHTVPYSIRPTSLVNVWFCGQGCNNHFLGTTECGDCMGQVWMANGVRQNNNNTNKSLKEWGKICEESGAQLWFWYYGVQYHTVAIPLPNILNLYYDIKFLYDECNCKGIYYEGGGNTYNFETLKAYMAAKMIWEPDMSYEQYVAYLKEYLYIHYGNGYEELFRFIEMQNTAGDKCGTCFISNFDGAGDCYSYKYIRDNYEDMRALLVIALEKAKRSDQKQYVQMLLNCFDFLGLSCSYWKMYRGYGVENEDEKAELRARYEELYTEMYNNLTGYEQEFEIEENGERKIIKVNGINFFGNDYAGWKKASLSSSPDFDEPPCVQVFADGDNISTWTHRSEVANFFLKGIESDAVES